MAEPGTWTIEVDRVSARVRLKASMELPGEHVSASMAMTPVQALEVARLLQSCAEVCQAHGAVTEKVAAPAPDRCARCGKPLEIEGDEGLCPGCTPGADHGFHAGRDR